MMCRSSHFSVSYRPASQMVTSPPPYSPAAIVPSNDAYSSGWSSVGTASRFTPGSSGGALGTAQLLRTPSRSSRRSQCTRSPCPRPARVQEGDLAAAVLAGGDRALEGRVPERVVFGGHGQPVHARLQRRRLGHRPALEDAVALQPQVPVHPLAVPPPGPPARCVVLL